MPLRVVFCWWSGTLGLNLFIRFCFWVSSSPAIRCHLSERRETAKWINSAITRDVTLVKIPRAHVRCAIPHFTNYPVKGCTRCDANRPRCDGHRRKRLTMDQLLVNGINTLLITSRGDPATSRFLQFAGRGKGRGSEPETCAFCMCTRATVCGLPWMTIRYSFPARIIAGFTATEKAARYTTAECV